MSRFPISSTYSFPADDVTARRRQSPARIFDERADRDVRADVTGLLFLDEFPVTVVHEDAPLKTERAHFGAGLPDFGHGERVAQLVPAGTLDINHFQPAPERLYPLLRARHVKLSLSGEREALEGNPEIFQGAVSLPENDAAQSIVRHSGQGKYFVPRPEQPEKRHA